MTGTARPFAGLTWPVHTDRTSIRPAEASDAASTWTYRRIPEVGEYLTSAPTGESAYRERFVDADRLAVTLVVEHDGRVIGDLMLRLVDGWAQAEVAAAAAGCEAELGWAFDPAYGGRGLATEAVAALLRVCFVDLGLRRVTAGCFAANLASARLMARVGMRRECHSVRDALHRTGVWMDGYLYALLADEWHATHDT